MTHQLWLTRTSNCKPDGLRATRVLLSWPGVTQIFEVDGEWIAADGWGSGGYFSIFVLGDTVERGLDDPAILGWRYEEANP